jgi:O-antigen/teichoic acid export membrane protein
VTRNAAALLSARLVSIVATLSTTPFLLDRLGTRGFGVWAVLLGAAAVAGLADLGLGSAQVRAVAGMEFTGDVRRVRATLALGLVFSLGISLALLTGVLTLWQPFASAFHLGALTAPAQTAALLLVVAFAIDALAVPWRAVLEGGQRMRPIAFAAAAGITTAGALGVAAVLGGAGLVGLGWSAIAGSLVRAAILVGAARRHAPAIHPSFRAIDRLDLREVFSYSVRVQVTNAASAVNTETDRLVLGGFFTPATVAQFDVGSKLVAALRIVPSYALTAVFPLTAALHAGGRREQLDRLYLRATRYIGLFACLSATAIAAGAGPLVMLWLGRPLPLAAATIVVLAPAYALNLTSGAAAAVARAEGAPGRETRYAVLAAVLNAALTVPLLFVVGPLGVPISTAVAYVVATAYFFVHFHHASRRPLRPLAALLWKPFLAAGLAFPLASLLGSPLGAPSGRLEAAVAVAERSGFALAVAVVLLAAFRFFDAGDRALVGRARTLLPAAWPAARSGGSSC